MSKKFELFVFLLIALLLESYAAGFTFKKILSIGGEEEHNTFFKISGAVISPDKDIYVGDFGGNFLARYDWQGKLIKRTGKRGKGPGDFQGIIHLNFYDNSLYVSDIHNRRIAVLDRNLNHKRYIKPSKITILSNGYAVLGKDRYLGSFSQRVQDKEAGRARFGFFNNRGEFSGFFFTKDQSGESKELKTSEEWGRARAVSRLYFALTDKNRDVMIAFNYPKHPARFYIYNSEGSFVKEVLYQFDDNYKFPEFLREMSGRLPKKLFKYASVSSVLSFKEYFMVFLNYCELLKRKDTVKKSICLVYDSKGVLKGEVKAPHGVRFFSSTKDGYLICINREDEVPGVHIYKFSI